MASTVESAQHGGAHSHHGPLPLPAFTFPAPSPTPTPSYSRRSPRRPVSAFELGPGATALPSFSFGGATNSGLASPPLSPGTRSIPTRPAGHKRGASELIGRDGGADLLSSSPTRGASSLGPVPGRKGHQHRRSAAISISDVSLILKPDSVPRAGSAPVSPAGGGSQGGGQDHRQLRFAEEIEVIPRPLSMVSSESSGTTVRAGHSATGSFSSLSAPSPPREKQQSPPSNNTTDTRPKTAAARLDFKPEEFSTTDCLSPRRHSSNPLLTDLPSPATPATPSTPRSASKKWNFFGHEDSTPQTRPTSSGSSKEPRSMTAEPSSPLQTSPKPPIESTEQPLTRQPSASRKTGKKKQKKVKSWAGSILSRKSRQRSQKQSRRSPTPPHRSYGSMSEKSMPDLTQPDESAPDAEAPVKPEMSTDFSSWVPRRVQIQEDESSMTPIIDLDAALGPFNTPSGRDSEWDAFHRGSGPIARAKRMHSAAGMGNFGGPGMHYHRRAASSPEFENPRFGIRHLNSSSTMADVFEEDEEDDEWEDSKPASDKENSGKVGDDEEGSSGIDIKVVDAEDMHANKEMDWTLDESSMRGVKRKGSGLSEGERRQATSSMKSTNSSASVKDEVIPEEPPSIVKVADDVNPPRPDSGAQSSDSTATPPLQPKPTKDLAPVDVQPFSLQPPYATPTSPNSMTQSSLPSPRSPFSYDTQRISTAPSSITDEGGFQSLLLGEPGPELRISVDGVPSLTSSNSTMTSFTIPTARTHQFREGQRSASLSSAAVTRKRSSIASLSRLISSSHGEKSKLSIESRPPSIVETDKKEKISKGKRISRMMQFWKPRDAAQ